MSDSLEFFEKYFKLVSGDDKLIPYPWQTEIFNKIIAGDWPDSVALPTGAGKTAILKIWLLALGWSLIKNKPGLVPRRIVWVVNRRVVVDQATKEAEKMAAALSSLLASGDKLALELKECSFEKNVPLAVSTLRGEKADNRRWSQDPLQPAIVIGTVDMVGSRLLFRGYGDGKYFRPYHAGLLGVDAVIVNDESHLTPAFATLLASVADMQPSRSLGKPFHVLMVSATARSDGGKPFEHDIRVDASASERFRRVFEAKKRLRLHEASDKTAATARMLQLALAEGATRTIVFVEQPEDAAKFKERLAKELGEDASVCLLTGTMRGRERDLLSQDETFKRFGEPAMPSSSRHFLVTTSAGEVGIDISGERLVSMVRESDVMMQRLGRLNRFGDQDGEEPRSGEAEFVFVAKKATEATREGDDRDRVAATERYLLSLTDSGKISIDVSCKAFWETPPPPETRSEEPLLARLESRLIDLWSQTSFNGGKDSAIPAVDSWLHGKNDDYARTGVAWRAEVKHLASGAVADKDLRKAIQTYRLLPQETLTEPTGRLRKKLAQLPDQETEVLFRDRNGDVTATTVETLTDENRFSDFLLADGVVLLPEGFGWLANGMLRTESDGALPGNDVADEDSEEGRDRKRYLIRTEDDGWRITTLGTKEDSFEADLKSWKDSLSGKLLQINLSEGDDEASFLLLRTGIDAKVLKRYEVDLKSHSESVAKGAAEIAALALSENSLADTFRSAGSVHDGGKNCHRWQNAMGGSVDWPLAKTKRAVRPSDLEGYRHELGSVLEAQDRFSCDDLLLHMIGSHHGWARPHWDEKAYLTETTDFCKNSPLLQSQRAALEALGRFERLQSTWGAWGLAYLEALFKAADASASRKEEGLKRG